MDPGEFSQATFYLHPAPLPKTFRFHRSLKRILEISKLISLDDYQGIAVLRRKKERVGMPSGKGKLKLSSLVCQDSESLPSICVFQTRDYYEQRFSKNEPSC